MGYDITEVSGQATLPGFEALVQVEAAILPKPEQELFCVKFVEFGGDRARAYQAAIDPTASRLQAQKNSCKLLKKEELRRRIAELSTVFRNRVINDVIAYRTVGLKLDRVAFLDEHGKLKPLSELTDEQRMILDIETRWVDGAVRTIPVVTSREKSAEALQKIMAMDKSVVSVTGKDGGPIEHRHELSDAALEAIALGRAAS